MKNPDKRNLDAISAQFRTSAGAMLPKKEKQELRRNRKKALREIHADDEET